MKTFITDKQVGRLALVGSNEITGGIIEQSYFDVLRLLDAHLKAGNQFLLGSRPHVCDFALYGQLSQLCLFDPSSVQIAEKHFPRCIAWTQLMEDLSGFGDYPWPRAQDILNQPTLKALLVEVGATY